MDYEVIDKNGNRRIIKDVKFTYTENGMLVLQISKGDMNYFNIADTLSAVVIEEESND